MQDPPTLQALLAEAQSAQVTGNGDLAERLMKDAIGLAPGNPAIHRQLASLLATRKRWREALEHFDTALRLDPDDGQIWYLAGLALLNVRRFPQAVYALARAMQRLDANDRVQAAFAEALFHGGLPDVALAWWRGYASAHPNDPTVQLRLGELLSRNGLHQEALHHFRVLDESAGEPGVSKQIAVAQAHEDIGDRAAAREAYLEALAVRPDWALPVAGLLQLQQATVEQPLESQAMRLLDRSDVPDHEAALLNYALGKVYDARGQYTEAMDRWHEANRLRRLIAGEPNPTSLMQRVDSLVRHTVNHLAGLPVLHADADEPQLVFIVGMPRSGTTLTERILGSHPLAHGGGELAELPLLAQSLRPELQGYQPAVWDRPTTRDSLQGARNAYVRAIRRGADRDKRVLIDKAPLNFFNLWLLPMLFPSAKVIWCRRHPLDVGVSIYSENFALDERLCTSLEGIGHYINAQERLMTHWSKTLDLDVHEVHYEDLVNDPEPRAEAILHFVGLEWDPRCLDFHKRDDGVQTPSRWQVRQPIHTRSIGRWRHYADHLAPLMAVLEQTA